MAPYLPKTAVPSADLLDEINLLLAFLPGNHGGGEIGCWLTVAEDGVHVRTRDHAWQRITLAVFASLEEALAFLRQEVRFQAEIAAAPAGTPG
ncbi:hypothetical protein [Thiomonas sp.]